MMSVIQTFTYTHIQEESAEKKAFICETDWAITLPADQLIAFTNSFAAQRALVNAQIAAGNLTETIENGVVWTWKDQASADAFVWDAGYKTFFDQYVAALGMTFNIVTTTA